MCADARALSSTRLLLAVHCRNRRAISTYRDAGFVDTGRWLNGGRAGPVHVMLRRLAAGVYAVTWDNRSMDDFRRRFLDLALHAQALRFGEFTLKSGRVSPYFFNAGRFDSGVALAALGDCYADAIDDARPGIRPAVRAGLQGHPAGDRARLRATRAAAATCRWPSTARKPRPTARAAP